MPTTGSALGGRDFFIPGQSLVLVKGNTASSIGDALYELGLASDQIIVSPEFRHRDINVDAWGEGAADVQFMLAAVNISMTLVHFDPDVMRECLRLSMAGGYGTGYGSTGGNRIINNGVATEGYLPAAGTRMGNNAQRFGSNSNTGRYNNYIGLNIRTPAAQKGSADVVYPRWRFLYTYLSQPPMTFPLGAEKSLVRLNWRAVPYTIDPWGGTAQNDSNATTAGGGSDGAILWDHGTD